MKRELLIVYISEWFGLPRKEFEHMTDKELEDQFDLIRSKLCGDY